MDARNKATASGFGETPRTRDKGGASGSALGFGFEERAMAKMCLRAFEDQKCVIPFALKAGPYEKMERQLDAELLVVLIQCLLKIHQAYQNPDVKFTVDRAYPLCSAVAKGFPRVVELFLGLGAEVDGVCADRTALLLASFFGDKKHIKVAQLLLDHGADPTFVAPDVWTPLDAAQSRGGQEAMAELLEAQPRVRRALRKRTCAYCEGVASVVQPPFQVCGGCMSRRYCSRDCQKAAWRSGHREACIFVPEL